jgi:hypothetical protein
MPKTRLSFGKALVLVPLLAIATMSTECAQRPGGPTPEFDVDVIGSVRDARGRGCDQIPVRVCVTFQPNNEGQLRAQCANFRTNVFGEFDGRIQSFRPTGSIRAVELVREGRRYTPQSFEVEAACPGDDFCRTFLSRLRFQVPSCEK